MEESGSKKTRKKNVSQLNERYSKRMTYVKRGLEAKYRGDYLNAMKFFNTYLTVVADIKEVEVGDLTPKLFNEKTDLPELLLISHIFWELCKIMDLAPRLGKEFNVALSKFITFSHGFNYQFVNAEMMRKFLRKGNHQHKSEFSSAYKKIYMAAKQCYLATHCFGENDPVTDFYRNIKNNFLLKYKWGVSFVSIYYRFSPLLVDFCQKHKFISFFLTNFFIRPLLLLLALARRP